MRLRVVVAACLMLGACAEGDDARQTTNQVLGDGTAGDDGSTTGGGMTGMGSITWTPATDGAPSTGPGPMDGSDTGAETGSEGGDGGPVDPFAPCQDQQAPVRPTAYATTLRPGALGPRFVGAPPAAGGLECDPFMQDCPKGEKCLPWANDGGPTWNATRCSPVDDNPGQIGDSCSVEGSAVSGVDDCDVGVMCFDVDSETNTGTCVEMCGGSEANPTCDTPGTTCTISNSGALVLCRAVCNPLANECGRGEGCYFVEAASVCAPDASDGMGAEGEPCEFINTCADGLFCSDASAVAGCETEFCCTSFCAVGDDSMCAPGQTCTSFFPDGPAPAECLEGLGACVL